jgi:hypothetical protein
MLRVNEYVGPLTSDVYDVVVERKKEQKKESKVENKYPNPATNTD